MVPKLVFFVCGACIFHVFDDVHKNACLPVLI
jgi:hypothetical protein